MVEVEPAGGYWTEILAPYLKATGGRYIGAVGGDPAAFKAKYADPAIWGDIGVVPLSAGPLAAPGSVDFRRTTTPPNTSRWGRATG